MITDEKLNERLVKIQLAPANWKMREFEEIIELEEEYVEPINIVINIDKIIVGERK